MVTDALIVTDLGFHGRGTCYYSLHSDSFQKELRPGLYLLSLIKNNKSEVNGVRLSCVEGDVPVASFNAGKAKRSEIALYRGGEFVVSYRLTEKDGTVVYEDSYRLNLTSMEDNLLMEEGLDGKVYLKAVATGQESVKVPPYCNGKEVYGILPYCFHDEPNLVSVTLPNGLRKISSYAFIHCPNLIDLDVPPNIEIIEANACYDCPKVVPPKLKKKRFISKKAFAGCDGKSRDILAHCDEEITSDKVLHLAYYAPETLQIPARIKKIGTFSFFGFEKIRQVELPEGLQSIGSSAFYGCKNLTDISLPSTLDSLGGFAFAYSSIKEAKLSKGLKEIPYSCFEGCKKLESVSIWKGLTKIDANAFAGCASLSEIALPSTLEYIGSKAFKGCKALSKITYEGKTEAFRQLEAKCPKDAFAGTRVKSVLCIDGPCNIG